MAPLTITIPHQLTKAEARRRIDSHIAELLGQYSSHLDHLDHHWTGDTLDFQAGVMGMTITGKVHVEDQAVRVEVVLPQAAKIRRNDVDVNLDGLMPGDRLEVIYRDENGKHVADKVTVLSGV